MNQEGGFSLDRFNRPDWYGRDYFSTHKGMKYRDASGQIHGWSYDNPSGEMQAADFVTRAWKKMFGAKNLLDVGCGRGTIIAYARMNRMEAYGFDFSDWALGEGLYSGCSLDWVKVHDATQPWPYADAYFDLVTALDFFEHIFIEDLPLVEAELLRVSKKWCFLLIAVSGSGGLQGQEPEGYVIRKGQPVPIELEANAVAGHVLVKPKKFWVKRFDALGFNENKEMLHKFSQLVYPPMIKNWWHNAILILEKK